MEDSVFDLTVQNATVEDRIVASLEKVSEAFRVLLWEESKRTGLSPIQVQLLVFLLYQPTVRATVTALAREFNMTKPTVSDAIKVLERKGLVVRTGNEADNRSYTLSLTANGRGVAESSGVFANVIKHQVRTLEASQQSGLLQALLEVIHLLQKTGVIHTQRMCKTCRFFAQGKGKVKHYCALMRQTLHGADLRLDCPEHVLAVSA
jgi:DNA-binding MarR family transcriptional regulator